MPHCPAQAAEAAVLKLEGQAAAGAEVADLTAAKAKLQVRR
jgi:hypothetical protein